MEDRSEYTGWVVDNALRVAASKKRRQWGANSADSMAAETYVDSAIRGAVSGESVTVVDAPTAEEEATQAAFAEHIRGNSPGYEIPATETESDQPRPAPQATRGRRSPVYLHAERYPGAAFDDMLRSEYDDKRKR